MQSHNKINSPIEKRNNFTKSVDEEQIKLFCKKGSMVILVGLEKQTGGMTETLCFMGPLKIH